MVFSNVENPKLRYLEA